MEKIMCNMEALAKALNPDKRKADGGVDQKRYKQDSIISISRQYLVKEEIDGKLAQHAFAVANKEA
ncbi:MAG: hypothetical protein EZS28_033176, partial [Streblomastix strix]